MRVLTIRKQGKHEGGQEPINGFLGGLISGGGLLPDVFFCLLVDGPITGGAYKRGLISGSLRYSFTLK